ncbi:hypothetical protein C0J52_19634 [Blattella germanica]|nr:hypothetical protein C0J52_19634 [Blattella germanica]
MSMQSTHVEERFLHVIQKRNPVGSDWNTMTRNGFIKMSGAIPDEGEEPKSLYLPQRCCFVSSGHHQERYNCLCRPSNVRLARQFDVVIVVLAMVLKAIYSTNYTYSYNHATVNVETRPIRAAMLISPALMEQHEQTRVLRGCNDAMASVTGAMCLHSVNNVQRYFPAAIRMENL